MTPGANPIWGDDWDEVRSLWLLDPEVAHCNHGSFGAVPGSVLDAQNELRRPDGDQPDALVPPRATWPGGRGPWPRWPDFIGAGPDEVALVNNVSAGVSAVVGRWRSNRATRSSRPITPMERCRGQWTGCAPAPAPPGWWPRYPSRPTTRKWRRSSPSTAPSGPAWSLVDQVTSPTARRFPLEAIVRTAHDFNAPVLVDGAHAPGMLPLDMHAYGRRLLDGQPSQVGLHARRHRRALGSAAMAGADALPHRLVGRTGRLPRIVRASRHRRPLGLVGRPQVARTARGPGLGPHPQAQRRPGLLGTGQGRRNPWRARQRAEPRRRGSAWLPVPLPLGWADTKEQAQAIQEHMVTRGCRDGDRRHGAAAAASACPPTPTTPLPITSAWPSVSAT